VDIVSEFVPQSPAVPKLKLEGVLVRENAHCSELLCIDANSMATMITKPAAVAAVFLVLVIILSIYIADLDLGV
jgi:hypothetical protein